MGSILEHPAPDAVNLVEVLAALADPGRLAILAVLAAGELSCGEIRSQAGLDWSKSTASHHLRVMREAGITHTRVVGAHRLVSLRRAELDARFPGLFDALQTSAAPPSVLAPVGAAADPPVGAAADPAAGAAAAAVPALVDR